MGRRERGCLWEGDEGYRSRGWSVRGDKHPWSKLNKEQVIKIRALLTEGKASQIKIGKQFGVLQNTISAIKNRINWKHI